MSKRKDRKFWQRATNAGRNQHVKLHKKAEPTQVRSDQPQFGLIINHVKLASAIRRAAAWMHAPIRSNTTDWCALPPYQGQLPADSVAFSDSGIPYSLVLREMGMGRLVGNVKQEYPTPAPVKHDVFSAKSYAISAAQAARAKFDRRDVTPPLMGAVARQAVTA